MDKFAKTVLFLLRISLGWIMFYAGITKILDPAWSAEGFLNNAQTFSGFYAWLAQDSILPVINFMNEWALLLLGVSLILGIFTRVSSYLGALLMLLYYFPSLDFPYLDHSFLIDEHIIYILVLLMFATSKVGNYWGLDGLMQKKK